MIEIRRTETFIRWVEKLRDRRARALIATRISRLERGNFGDAKPVGDGVCELRIHYGPAYRLYYVWRGQTLVVLLCGGNKSTQARDIKAAKALAANWGS